MFEPGDADFHATACRVLRAAQEIAGGPEQLADQLSIHPRELAHWLGTKTPPPWDVFDRALEMVLNDYERRGRRQLK